MRPGPPGWTASNRGIVPSAHEHFGRGVSGWETGDSTPGRYGWVGGEHPGAGDGAGVRVGEALPLPGGGTGCRGRPSVRAHLQPTMTSRSHRRRYRTFRPVRGDPASTGAVAGVSAGLGRNPAATPLAPPIHHGGHSRSTGTGSCPPLPGRVMASLVARRAQRGRGASERPAATAADAGRGDRAGIATPPHR